MDEAEKAMDGVKLKVPDVLSDEYCDVGAGGLGITINERIGWRDYNSLGMVLLSLFVVVVAIDFFSEYLRKKLS